MLTIASLVGFMMIFDEKMARASFRYGAFICTILSDDLTLDHV